MTSTTIQSEYEAITSKNAIFTEHQPRWKFLFESYVGGELYQRGRHLNKYLKESDAEYEARIRVTPLDNQCASVISVYNSFLFREEPEREFGSLEGTAELEDFLKDADFENRSLDHFMKEVSAWACVFGHCWVMVNKPDIGAVSLADEIAANVRPYVSLMTPLVVIDWSWSRSASGRYTLDYFKYIEDLNGSVQTIKEWTLDTITTATVDTEKFTVLNKEVISNTLNLIPAFACYNDRSIVRGIGISAINDIADAQRFIYNATSEVDQSIRLNTHPSLVICSEGTDVGVGAGGVINVSRELPPELKPYVLTFSVTGVPDIYQAINTTIQSIEKMANVGAVRATESRTLSGVALETEFQLLNSRLSRMADNLELAEEQIWRLFCMYQNKPYNVTVEYPGSFNTRDTASEINQLKTASETTQDPTVQAAIAAEVLNWMDLDAEEIAALEINTDNTADNVVSE